VHNLGGAALQDPFGATLIQRLHYFIGKEQGSSPRKQPGGGVGGCAEEGTNPLTRREKKAALKKRIALAHESP